MCVCVYYVYVCMSHLMFACLLPFFNLLKWDINLFGC